MPEIFYQLVSHYLIAVGDIDSVTVTDLNCSIASLRRIIYGEISHGDAMKPRDLVVKKPGFRVPETESDFRDISLTAMPPSSPLSRWWKDEDWAARGEMPLVVIMPSSES